MAETLVNYGIFFLVIILIAIGAAIVRRSTILTNLFKFFGKTMFIILNVLMLIVFTIIMSIGAGIIIMIHPYLYGKPLFFVNGEGVHLLATQDHALLLFSLTYGVLYMLVFIISSGFLMKTRIAKIFTYIARILRFISRYKAPHHKYKKRVYGTASHLITLCIVFILYPIAIATLFPELELAWLGNFTLFISMLLFSLVPDPRYRDRQNETRYFNVG